MEFDALRDLVQVISRNKVKQIEVLGNPGQEDSRIEAFYDGIAKNNFTSDEAAAKFFFGVADAKDPNYKKMRNRLVRQLINTSFFVDVNLPMFNDRSKAYYNCYRDYAAALILVMRKASKASVYILQQLLEQTIKYEFIELTADVARLLRQEYARSQVDQSNHEYYSKIHRQYEEKRRGELLALDYQEELIHYYIVRRSPNEDVHRLATVYFDELQGIAPEVDSSAFYAALYRIGIIKYLSQNDCENVLKVCDEAIVNLQNRKNTGRGALFSIAIQKFTCLMQLRRFDSGEAEATFIFCLKTIEEGDFNWFRLHEVYAIYCLHARQYDKALQIFTTGYTHPRFNMLSGTIRDNWNLLEGYFHLLTIFNKLRTETVTKVIGEFRLSRFVNDMEVLTKDKEGMNIPLVFLPILYHVASGTLHQSTISIDAIEKYRKRYLDNDLNRRSACFLNLMTALSRKPFELKSAERKIEKELAILQKEAPQVSRQTSAIEIIPYEDLWQTLLEATGR